MWKPDRVLSNQLSGGYSLIGVRQIARTVSKVTIPQRSDGTLDNHESTVQSQVQRGLRD